MRLSFWRGLLVLSVFILLVYVVVIKGGTTYENTGKAVDHQVAVNDEIREYSLYVPDNYNKDMALIVALHDFGNFNYNFMTRTGFNQLAETYGFVVCYPQSLIAEHMSEGGWNAAIGAWDADFESFDQADMDFLTGLCENLQKDYELNGETYLFGYDIGGFMCYTMALNRPDLIDGIAVVGGGMSHEDWEDRGKAQPMPVMHIYGADDPLGNTDGYQFLEHDWHGPSTIESLAEFWAEVNGCESCSENGYGDIMTLRSYEGGINGNQVAFYSVKGLDHDWPSEAYVNNWKPAEAAVRFFGLAK